MKSVKVLGPGCPKCRELFETTQKVIADRKIECELTKVTDINEIVSFGIMITPALVVDGEVRMSGRVPSPDEIEGFLK
jgi:small redox-active disulfide protein 2